jgi:hypothetical protein
MSTDSMFPDLPAITIQELQHCDSQRDHVPIYFKWFQHLGMICATVVAISRKSPAWRSISTLHYAVLVGLLNRCSRLMVSILALASHASHGESIRILGRCLAETAVKIEWICQEDTKDRIERYLEDGLWGESRLRRAIEKEISQREGRILHIEQRLLNQIREIEASTALPPSVTADPRRLHNFASMCSDLGLPDVLYPTVQHMGSHAVHGTWPDLLENCLVRRDSGELEPRVGQLPPEGAQFAGTTRLVARAISAFATHMSTDERATAIIQNRVAIVDNAIVSLMRRACGKDFEIVNGDGID